LGPRAIFAGVAGPLRFQVIEGRMKIHWEFDPKFVHRGFMLIAKRRRNEGDWLPLALEAHQDSGSWIECFNYGESRSYLFTVKSTYRFFFGMFDEPADEVVCDQISFSVRKGRYLKEKKELIRDRRELLEELNGYMRAGRELKGTMSVLSEKSASPPPKTHPTDAPSAASCHKQTLPMGEN
jgi:hypothetical protein